MRRVCSEKGGVVWCGVRECSEKGGVVWCGVVRCGMLRKEV